MKTHIIKLNKLYCDDVLNGNKTFEVRKNDRDYQVEDEIKFIPWDNGKEFDHPLKEKSFEITYILDNKEYCKDDYVIFSFRLIAEWKEDGSWYFYKCSNCGHTEPYYVMVYCPVCGARMK